MIMCTFVCTQIMRMCVYMCHSVYIRSDNNFLKSGSFLPSLGVFKGSNSWWQACAANAFTEETILPAPPFGVLKQVIHSETQAGLKLTMSTKLPWTHGPLALVSSVLRLQVCVWPCLTSKWLFPLSKHVWMFLIMWWPANIAKPFLSPRFAAYDRKCIHLLVSWDDFRIDGTCNSF